MPRPARTPWKILLRLFVMLHGQKVILLLHGYDKSRNDKPLYHQQQIKIAKVRAQQCERNSASATVAATEDRAGCASRSAVRVAGSSFRQPFGGPGGCGDRRHCRQYTEGPAADDAKIAEWVLVERTV